MSMLKRFIKKGEQDNQSSPPSSPYPKSEYNKSEIKDEAQGFICPVCMASLSSPQALQSHFDSVHDDNNADGNMVSELSPTTMRKLTRNEIDMNRQLLKASEESRTLLGAEVSNLQSQLSQLKKELQDAHSVKDKLQTKAANQARTIAECKARADESEARTIASDDHILTLKNQLSEKIKFIENLEEELSRRPSHDDVNVLQKELIHIQSNMDRLSQDGEKERQDLREKLLSVQAQRQKSELRVQELEIQLASVSKIEDIESLQSKLEEVEKSLILQNETIHCQNLRIQEQESRLGQETTRANDYMKQTEQQAAMLSELKQTVLDKSAKIENLAERLTGSSLSLENCQSELEKVRRERHDMEADRDSLEKQLTDVRLDREQCLEDKRVLEASLDKYTSDYDELNKELKRVTEVLHSSSSELDTVKHHLNDSRNKLSELQLEKERELGLTKVQIEKVTVHLEAKTTQVNELKEEVRILSERLQQECSNNDELQGRLIEKEANSEAESRSIKMRDERISNLETQLAASVALSQKQDMERMDLLSRIENGEEMDSAISQLRTEYLELQERLATQDENAKKEAEEFREREDDLHQKLAEVKGQLQTSQEKYRKFKNDVKEKDEKLKAYEQKVTVLESDLDTKRELLLASDQSKESQRIDLESHVQSLKKSLNEKTEEASTCKVSLTEAESEIAACKDKITALEEKLSNENSAYQSLKKQCDSLTSQHQQTESELKIMQGKLDSSHEDLLKGQGQIQSLITTNRTFEEEIEKCKEKHAEDLKSANHNRDSLVAQLENERDQHMARVAMFESERERITMQLDELKMNTDRTEVALHNLGLEKQKLIEDINQEKEKSQLERTALINEHQSQISALNIKCQSLESDLLSAEADKTELLEFKAASLELTNHNSRLSSELEELKNNYNAVSVSNEDMKKDIVSLREEICDKDERISKDQSDFENLTLLYDTQTNKLSELEIINQELISEKEQLLDEKKSLENAKEEVTTSLSDLHKELNVSQENLNSLRQRLEQQKTEHQEEYSAMHKARDLLISQKLELQTKISQLEHQISLGDDRLEQEKAASLAVAADFTQQISTLQATVEELKSSREILERERDEDRVRADLELATLSDNLSHVRSELLSVQSMSESAVQSLDEVKGEKLELEAKLENNNDERRLLLERCLVSENECEKLRDKANDLRRKLEDTQAGLHELGRENQSLQISTAKAQNRRWASDQDVNCCMSCFKPFSVTVRKHHCRNCGNIYCNECSSKLSPIPSSKKPSRVCDDCFTILSKR